MVKFLTFLSMVYLVYVFLAVSSSAKMEVVAVTMDIPVKVAQMIGDLTSQISVAQVKYN
jgi:hypothetical protein